MTDKLAQFKHPRRDKTNRHIVDRLAETRARLKLLKGLEEDLKNIILQDMGDGDILCGDEYIATCKMAERVGNVDLKAMEAYGIDVEKYRKSATTTVTLRLEKRFIDD